MDEYHVVIRPEALAMLDRIYENICYRSLDDSRAEAVIAEIERNF